MVIIDIIKKIVCGIANIILTNRFVQCLIVIMFLNWFPGNLFKHTKFGIFINGTDNTYHNNYASEAKEK